MFQSLFKIHPWIKSIPDVLHFLIVFSIPSCIHAQVSLPERNPFKLSLRGGVIANNNDLAAELRSKADNEVTYTINTDYAAIGEIELSADLIKFRGASLCMQVSALYSQPEYKAKGPAGSNKVGQTHMGIVRANVAFSFNGSDPYTMFELPYHSNKEAVLGISGMLIRTENTTLTSYATDSLKIKSIEGEYSSALGINFGWNWRLGESGWVAGINGAVMFVLNKSHLADVITEDESEYSSGTIDFAPRLVTAGIGYHF
jgi:hypothetical protein